MSLRFVVGALLMLFANACLAADDGDSPSLKDAYAADFRIGVALGGNPPHGYSPEELELLQKHFSIITPENGMKMEHVQATEGVFDFRQADAIVRFARENRLPVVGHTLVWARDNETPEWFFKDGDQPASRDLLLQRMKGHIGPVAGRYRGEAVEWDVVNEVIDESEEGYLRPSKWLEIAGPDFIAEAFRAAHAAAPDALLILNDFANEKPGKRARTLRLVRELKEQGVPIHAVGLQGHVELDRIPLQDFEATFNELRELGLKAVISELDVGVVPRGRWWADGGKHREELRSWDPYKDGAPEDVLARQAEQYAELFRLLRRHSDVVERVTFWNLHDGRSWLNYFPWRRTEHPQLFDRAARPKPAFEAVLRVAEESN